MRTLITAATILFALSLSGLVLGQESPPASNLKMVTIEVVIAQYKTTTRPDARVDLRGADDVEAKLRELDNKGAFTSLSRVTLTTLSSNKAMVQVGERVAIPTGRTFAGRGRGGEGNTGNAPNFPFAVQYSPQDVGTLVSVMPDVQDDGTVIVDLKVEQSQLAPPSALRDPNDPGAGDIPSSQIVNLRSESTLAIHPGHTVVVGGQQDDDEKKSSQTVILVSARIAE